MEKLNSSEANEQLIIKYDDLLNTIYLGLAREHSIPGAIESSDFSALLDKACATEEERYAVVVKLGAAFDKAVIRALSPIVMIHRKDIIIEVPPNGGVGQTDYYPWKDSLTTHLNTLQRHHDAEDRRSCTIRSLGEVGTAEINAAAAQTVIDDFPAQSYEEDLLPSKTLVA